MDPIKQIAFDLLAAIVRALEADGHETRVVPNDATLTRRIEVRVPYTECNAVVPDVAARLVEGLIRANAHRIGVLACGPKTITLREARMAVRLRVVDGQLRADIACGPWLEAADDISLQPGDLAQP